MPVPAPARPLHPRIRPHPIPRIGPRRGQGIVVSLVTLPLGVIQHMPAIHTQVEVSGDQPGVPFLIVPQSLQHQVDPLLRPRPGLFLEVDPHGDDQPRHPLVPDGPLPAAIPPVPPEPHALDPRHGGVDLVDPLLPMGLHKRLEGLLTAPLRVVHQRGPVMPRVHVIPQQTISGPGPPLPRPPDRLDSPPLPLGRPHAPGTEEGSTDARIGEIGVLFGPTAH